MTRHVRTRWNLLWSLMLLCTSTIVRPLHAADESDRTLDTVESQLGQHKHGEPPRRRVRDYDDTYRSSRDASLAGALIELLFYGLMAGSEYAGQNWSELHQELRSEWKPLLPTARAEGAYHYINGHNDITAFTLNATAGYLLFGADVDYVQYFESTPNTQLKITSPHGLLRFAPLPALQIDLAVGAKIIRGRSTHQGTEVGLPIYVFAGKHVIFDVKPYWAVIQGTQTSDVAVGVSYKWKPIGVRAAYRWIRIGEESLHGPTIGLFAQW